MSGITVKATGSELHDFVVVEVREKFFRLYCWN